MSSDAISTATIAEGVSGGVTVVVFLIALCITLILY